MASTSITNQSVFKKLVNRRYMGGCPQSLLCLGPNFVVDNRGPQMSWDVLDCVTSLNRSFWEDYDNSFCLDKLHKIYELIVDDRQRSTDAVKTSTNVENLISMGGLEVLQTFILEYPLNFEGSKKTESQKRKELDAYDKVRFLAIQALHTLSTSNPVRTCILSKLSNNIDLIRKLLDSLASRLLGYVSMLLLEDLMVHRDKPLDLRQLDVDNLMISLNLEQMSNLCRVLSYTVVDMGSEPEELLCAIDSSKRRSRRNSAACEKNITYLASLPRLMVSVIEIIVRKFEPNNKLFMEYLGVAIDILEESSSPANSLIASIRMTYMGNHDSTGQFPPLNNNTEQLISAMNRIEVNKDLTMRIEGCILLTGLLYGTMRCETIQKLNQYKLIPRINDLFNFFFAIDPETGTLTTDQYGFIEGESLIQSLRIQILRLIHSVCDQTLNNSTMLTDREFSELEACRDPYNVLAPVTFNRQPGLMCRGSSGLLAKMNDLAKRDLAPFYRFWLNRAIESFLRGKTLYPYQVFMSQAGLIENTVDRILALEEARLPHRNSEIADGADVSSALSSQVGNNYEDIIQCSFDLLAQMVKFNVTSLQLLSTRLFAAHVTSAQETMDTSLTVSQDSPSGSSHTNQGSPLRRLRQSSQLSNPNPSEAGMSFSGMGFHVEDEKSMTVTRSPSLNSALQKFVNIIFDNIIDSNMFVRCIILSIDKFESLGPKSSAMKSMSDNVLITRFSHFATRLKYICRILRCINVDTLTQDNVSCLNTALAILLFAHDRHQLPMYLEALLEVEQNPAEAMYPGMRYFENLFQLCLFWKRHYQPQGQDVKCLVEGSGIEFPRWRNCVDTLLKRDPSDFNSLCAYCPSLRPS